MVEITRPQTIPRAAQTQPIIKSLFSFIVFQFQVHDGDSPPLSHVEYYIKTNALCALVFGFRRLLRLKG